MEGTDKAVGWSRDQERQMQCPVETRIEEQAQAIPPLLGLPLMLLSSRDSRRQTADSRGSSGMRLKIVKSRAEYGLQTNRPGR